MSHIDPFAPDQRSIQRTVDQLLDDALSDVHDYLVQSTRTLMSSTARRYATALAELHDAMVRDFLPVSHVGMAVFEDDILGSITVHCTVEELACADCLEHFSPRERHPFDGTRYVQMRRDSDGFVVELIIPPDRDGDIEPDAITGDSRVAQHDVH
mgnify:CR=1 FL=1